MTMSLTEYETTVIIRPDIGGDAVEGTLDRVRDVIKNRGGKLLAINHWGKRKLAYEIQKHARGVFVHTHFLGGNTLVHELERNMRINDNVLRFMTIQLAQNVDAESREEKAYERPQYDLDDGSEDAQDGMDDEEGQEQGRSDRYNDDNAGSGSSDAGEED
jgi:small subunit ribosomal protein S6